jgi:hypothetical protein
LALVLELDQDLISIQLHPRLLVLQEAQEAPSQRQWVPRRSRPPQRAVALLHPVVFQ